MEFVKCVECKNMILENECKFIGSPYVGKTYTNFICLKCDSKSKDEKISKLENCLQSENLKNKMKI
jgi:hypothetical protein